MLQALIEIPFSIGIPMSCASFFLVMCIQDYPTTVNCELAEESETVSGWECDSFHLCIPIFGELTSPQLLRSKYYSTRNLQRDFTEGNLDIKNSLQFWKSIE
jgi:hypothetical protein